MDFVKVIDTVGIAVLLANMIFLLVTLVVLAICAISYL